jgi:hypothetical protein
MLPDGLDLFITACAETGVSFMPLIEKTCKWVDPRTFELLPVWFPDSHRGARLYDARYEERCINTNFGGETSQKSEANIQAGKAIHQAMGIRRSYNWTVCHIWRVDDPTFQRPNIIVRDPRYYSCIGNMVLLPTPLKALTDSVLEIKYMLRVCAYNLYGWVPSVSDDSDMSKMIGWIKSGSVPPDYPQGWPATKGDGKMPLGVMPFCLRIANAIRSRKQDIKRKLESSLLPNYPRDSVRGVLKFWEIEL